MYGFWEKNFAANLLHCPKADLKIWNVGTIALAGKRLPEIYGLEANHQGIGVDTMEDLLKAERPVKVTKSLIPNDKFVLKLSFIQRKPLNLNVQRLNTTYNMKNYFSLCSFLYLSVAHSTANSPMILS